MAAPIASNARADARSRRATTLLELLVVLALLAVVSAMTVPLAGRREDRRRAHGAAVHAATLLGSAREEAVARGSAVAVALDTGAGVIRVIAGAGRDTLRTRDLAALFGVRLRATRDSLAYDARGLGIGAANLTLVFSRGAAAETLVISRLGRLRW